jgi:CDP-diacylglycerol--serine O-phosphatidyltransferase
MPKEIIIQNYFLFILPIIFSGVGHMLIVKWNICQQLAIPIYAPFFGKSKTWRGIVVMPSFTIIYFILLHMLGLDRPFYHFFSSYQPVLFGFLLGIIYCLSELPNSFIKRRLKIPEGKRPEKYKMFFLLLDQLDSTIGCTMIYWLNSDLSTIFWLGFIAFAILIAISVKIILFFLKVRKEPV